MPQPLRPSLATPSSASPADIEDASNALLVRRFRGRDPSAFAELFRRHRDLVYAVCMGRLRHHQDAEDLTQETFRRLAVSIDRWDSARPLEPWLVRIAGNRCRSFLSRKKGEFTGADWSEASPITPATASSEAESELREELQAAIETLPDHLQTAFILIHQEGWTYQQTSRHLRQPVGTIKTHVHRARLQLIERLRQRDPAVRPRPSEKAR